MDVREYEYFSFRNSRSINVASPVEDRTFPAHRHSYGEILVVGEGEKNIFKINDKMYSLTKGDVILVWPMELHEIVDADRDNAVIIQYSNAFADSLFDFKRITNLYHDLHLICVNAHPDLANKLASKINKMKEIMFSDVSNREMRCAMLLMEFMLILEDHHEELAQDISNDGGTKIAENTLYSIISVMDYIKGNLAADDLSQNAMAEMAGISKDYFSRVFKDVTGQNYIKWLNAIRVEKAISLFPESCLSLTEIAMLSGFKSIPSFNRVFAEYKGIPPSRYRKIYTDSLSSSM